MRTEVGASRSVLEDRLARPVVHLAYPVGDAGSAGSREFRAASDFGFASAVTTRPGLIYPAHSAHMTALPRVSINGHWQKTSAHRGAALGHCIRAVEPGLAEVDVRRNAAVRMRETALQPHGAPRSAAAVRLTIGARGRVTDDPPLADDRHTRDRRHGADGAVRSDATAAVRRDDVTVRDPHVAVPGRRATAARRDAPRSVELRETIVRTPSESRRRAAARGLCSGLGSRPRRPMGRRDAATQASSRRFRPAPIEVWASAWSGTQQTETRRPEPDPRGRWLASPDDRTDRRHDACRSCRAAAS